MNLNSAGGRAGRREISIFCSILSRFVPFRCPVGVVGGILSEEVLSVIHRFGVILHLLGFGEPGVAIELGVL